MRVTRRLIGIAAAAALLTTGAALAARQERKPSQSRVAIAQALPALDGGKLEAMIVEVIYEPGGASPGAGSPDRGPTRR